MLMLRLAATLLPLWLLIAGHALAAQDCGRLIKTAAGPYDYRDYNVRNQMVPQVEVFHFTEDVEQLRGKADRYLASNISYMLSRFPNHDRALDAMSRLAVKRGEEHPEGSTYSISCWFQRAVVFQPGDPIVRLTYAIHLERAGRVEDAIRPAETALRLAPENPKIHYTLARLHFRLGQTETAVAYAKEAEARGFPIADLRQDLQEAGHWPEE